MSVATRRTTTRKLAVAAYHRLPRTCKKLVVVGCASVAYAATKCPRIPVPATAAYAIIYVQRVFPGCVACYHPVITGKTHGDWCAAQRSMECSTLLNGFLAMCGGARNFFVCGGRSCSHPVPRPGKLCDCCEQNITPTLSAGIAPTTSERMFSLNRL